MAFTIALGEESGRPVTVEYRTVPESGTATGSSDSGAVSGAGPCTIVSQPPVIYLGDAAVDYTAVAWTSETFLPGETSKNFQVTTNLYDSGECPEGSQALLVELRAPMNPATPLNAVIIDGVAVGTILEGNLPEMRIRDASADEGSAMGFEVVLSEPAHQIVTATYSTVERPADLRAATEGADYTGVTGTIEIPIGATAPTAATAISVPIIVDGDSEVDETFLVELSNVAGAVLADPSAVGTINGDTTCVDTTDPGAVPPPMTVDSPTAHEGDGQMTFTIQVQQPMCHSNNFTLSVSYPRGSALYRIDWVFEGQQGGSALLPQLASEVSFQVDLVGR